MSRRATIPRPVGPHCLITPGLIQGSSRLAHHPKPTIFQANCQRLSLAYAGGQPRARKLAAQRLFAAVEASSSILHDLRPTRYKVVPYLIELAAHSAHWLREPEEFRPSSEHSSLQVLALVRHLFARYPAPAWLEAALLPRRGRAPHDPGLSWFIHIAQGRNLRDAPGLPFPLTRRAAHFALAAPARMQPVQALLFGFLRALGGSDALVEELVLCSRWLGPRLDEIWLKLYEKILGSPRFPLHQVRPLIDYVKYRRFEAEPGDTFCLESHSVADLLNRMARWHAELQTVRARSAFGEAWDVPWASRLRAEALSGDSERGDYALAELRSPRELFDEGRRMHHCVASYSRSCAAGAMSIWSLRFSQLGRESGRVTIRVATAERRVVEARRFANAKIDALELSVIESWASANGLSVVDGL
jgi:hypothetical protein